MKDSEHRSDGPEVEELRSIERSRLQALVAADLTIADRLHAEDFQLITPTGRPLSKAAYLESVRTGDIRYRRWEPEGTMAVRHYGDVAVLRYQAVLEMGDPEHIVTFQCWHTDSYERRDGRWQVVWSQATAIRL